MFLNDVKPLLKWSALSRLPAVSLKVAHIDGRPVLVHQKLARWCATNTAGVQCAGLLKGHCRIEDLQARLSALGSKTPEQDALAFLNGLEQAGFFDADPQIAPYPSIQSIFFHVTSKCNLACRHCYKSAGPNQSEELTAQTVEKWIRDLASDGGRMVTFSGGEPLLWSELPGMLLLSAELGLKIQVLTNATLITPAWAELFQKTGAEIQVSVDGWTREIHESLRGDNSFQPLVQGVKTLRRFDVRHQQLVMACQLTPDTARNPEAMIEWAKRYQAGQLRFLPLRPEGRAVFSDRRFRGLTIPEMETFLDKSTRLARHWQGEIQISTGISGTALDRVPRPWCPIGQKLVIDSNGWIYPCVLMMTPPYAIGHVSQTRVSEVGGSHHKRQIIQAVHHRMDVIQKCRKCLWRAFCQAGCAGLPLAFGNTLTDTDDFCQWRKNWYESAIIQLLRSRRAEAGK